MVGLMVAGNMNGGPAGPALRALTLDQGWSVFAPDPASTHAELEAVVEFDDGSQASWRPPRARPLLAAATYHWDMWMRVAALGYPPVAQATARWALTQTTGARSRPVRVTLRRRWFTAAPPGSAGHRLWREADVYVQELPR